MSTHQMRITVDYNKDLSYWEIEQKCSDSQANYTLITDRFEVSRDNHGRRHPVSIEKLFAKMTGRDGALLYQNSSGENEAFVVRRSPGQKDLIPISAMNLKDFEQIQSPVSCSKTLSTNQLDEILSTDAPLKELTHLIPSAQVNLNGGEFDFKMLY